MRSGRASALVIQRIQRILHRQRAAVGEADHAAAPAGPGGGPHTPTAASPRSTATTHRTFRRHRAVAPVGRDDRVAEVTVSATGGAGCTANRSGRGSMTTAPSGRPQAASRTAVPVGREAAGIDRALRVVTIARVVRVGADPVGDPVRTSANARPPRRGSPSSRHGRSRPPSVRVGRRCANPKRRATLDVPDAHAEQRDHARCQRQRAPFEPGRHPRAHRSDSSVKRRTAPAGAASRRADASAWRLLRPIVGTHRSCSHGVQAIFPAMGARLQSVVHGAVLALIVGWCSTSARRCGSPVVLGAVVVYVIVGVTHRSAGFRCSAASCRGSCATCCRSCSSAARWSSWPRSRSRTRDRVVALVPQYQEALLVAIQKLASWLRIETEPTWATLRQGHALAHQPAVPARLGVDVGVFDRGQRDRGAALRLVPARRAAPLRRQAGPPVGRPAEGSAHRRRDRRHQPPHRRLPSLQDLLGPARGHQLDHHGRVRAPVRGLGGADRVPGTSSPTLVRCSACSFPAIMASCSSATRRHCSAARRADGRAVPDRQLPSIRG